MCHLKSRYHKILTSFRIAFDKPFFRGKIIPPLSLMPNVYMVGYLHFESVMRLNSETRYRMFCKKNSVESLSAELEAAE